MKSKDVRNDTTVVIPAYNEYPAVGDVVRELLAAVPELPVIVIDDGSEDNTADAARQAGAQVIQHTRNRGYGAALKTGMRAAETTYVATYVAMYDADGQHRPDDLVSLMELAPDFDIVIGSRGKDSHQPLKRMLGKWVLARVANTLVGRTIPDINSGMRVIRLEVILRYLHLLPNGFSASTTTTICMLHRGYDVEFWPIKVLPRSGHSTVKQLRDGFNTISLIVNLAILFNSRRVFLPPAAVLLAAGLAYGFVRAIIQRQGFPTMALLLVTMGLITGMFGLLAEQISAMRVEMFERGRE